MVDPSRKVKATLVEPDSVTVVPVKYARHDRVCPLLMDGGLADESYVIGDMVAPHEPLSG